MAIYGLALIAFDLVCEVAFRMYFRHFFTWNYPASSDARPTEIRIKLRAARLAFVVGVLLLILAGVQATMS